VNNPDKTDWRTVMSTQQKKLIANIGIVVSLVMSWWMVGSYTSQAAIHNDGYLFEESVPILGGMYFNDWLPVVGSIVFGIGWISQVAIATTIMRPLKRIGVGLISCFLPSILGGIILSIGTFHVLPIISRLMNSCLLLFMFGSLIGILFGVFLRIEKGYD
jgi:hypothetical protein